jgi:2-iminobutanoate/2-iminopropanoate deaminase
MQVEKILSDLPDPGVISNCLVVGDQIFLSGMTASSAQGPIGGDDMYKQAVAAFGKIRTCLRAAGADMADIIKMTVYVTDMSRRMEFGKARAEQIPTEPKPCATLVEVKGLAHPGLLVEVDVFAIRGVSRGAKK